MKRGTVIALAALVALSFGCRRQQPTPPPPTPEAPAAPAAPVTPDATAPTTPTGPTAPSLTPSGTGVAGEPIADLPEYPGATRVGYSVAPKVGFTRSVEAKFFTTDPFDKVRAYYQKAITDAGWRIVRTKSEFNEVEWELAKGTSIAEVEVDQERTGGVSVKLERRDR